MTAIIFKLVSNVFSVYNVGIVFFLLCLWLPSFSQNKIDTVSVGLKTTNLHTSRNGTTILCLDITNNTRASIYLVMKKDFDMGYNLETKELWVGLDKQPSNFHYLEFPKLRKIKPKSKISLNLNLSVADWKVVENGEWKIATSIGVLEEKKLKKKLKDLGFSLKDDIQMTVTDFLELQSVFYSNYISVKIQDE